MVTRRAPGSTAIILLAVAATAGASGPPPGWTTYRSAEVGYELSYPADLALEVYFGGQSGELRDAATGERLVDLELWPPDLCPRERPGTVAPRLGIERATTVTQADGDDGSSSCGRPITVREWRSGGTRLYELRLTCRGEHRTRRRVVHEELGTKGPTFFADVSQPWRTRVLMVDPVGADPRLGPVRRRIAPAVVRRIVGTITAVPLPDPAVVCIDDLGRAPAAAAR